MTPGPPFSRPAHFIPLEKRPKENKVAVRAGPAGLGAF